MKKRISILALALALLLSACGKSDDPAAQEEPAAPAAMQLTRVTLTEEEQALLRLADVPPDSLTVYAYQADDRLRSIVFHRYVLSDALTWEQDDSFNFSISNAAGLAAQGRAAFRVQNGRPAVLNLLSGQSTSRAQAPDLPDGLPESNPFVVFPLSQAADIEYGTETPVLIRSQRSDGTVQTADASLFHETDRFSGSDFTEAFTMTFEAEA